MDLHGLAEERSLAYHRRVAELLPAQPVSKYAAAREKDRAFGRAAFGHRLARPQTVLERLPATSLGPERLAAALEAVRADAAAAGR